MKRKNIIRKNCLVISAIQMCRLLQQEKIMHIRMQDLQRTIYMLQLPGAKKIIVDVFNATSAEKTAIRSAIPIQRSIDQHFF